MSSERLAYFNGELVPESEARISVFDSALVYGDVVFEVTRTFREQPFRLREHMERLYASMRLAEIDCGLTIDEMEAATYETIAANRGQFSDGFDFQITHNVSPGPLSIYRSVFPEGLRPTIVINCFSLVGRMVKLGPQYRTGVHGVIPSQRAVPAQFVDPKVKSRSRIYYIRAEHQAHRIDPQGWAVLLDGDGYIAEGVGSNVFLVHDGTLYSPEGRNILRGVTRNCVLELASNLGIPVLERNLEPYDLLNADEAFFTSTTTCVMPMTSFEGQALGAGAPGPITQRIMAAFNELVGLDIVAQAEAGAAYVAQLEAE
jgi:branched-chain amino acid aminotransferase